MPCNLNKSIVETLAEQKIKMNLPCALYVNIKYDHHRIPIHRNRNPIRYKRCWYTHVITTLPTYCDNTCHVHTYCYYGPNNIATDVMYCFLLTIDRKCESTRPALQVCVQLQPRGFFIFYFFTRRTTFGHGTLFNSPIIRDNMKSCNWKKCRHTFAHTIIPSVMVRQSFGEPLGRPPSESTRLINRRSFRFSKGAKLLYGHRDNSDFLT